MYEYLVSFKSASDSRDLFCRGSDLILHVKPIGDGRWDVAGHEGYMNMDVASLPEILQDAGYHTLHSGEQWLCALKLFLRPFHLTRLSCVRRKMAPRLQGCPAAPQPGV